MHVVVLDGNAERAGVVAAELARDGHEVSRVTQQAGLRACLARGGVGGVLVGDAPTDPRAVLGSPELAAFRSEQGGAALVVALTDTADDPSAEQLLDAGATDVWEVDTGSTSTAAKIRLDVALAYARTAVEHATLVRELALLRRVLDVARAAFCISDPTLPDNPVVYVNEAFLDLTGYAPADVLGRNCRFLQGRATDPASVRLIAEAVAAERSVEVELLNHRRDGSAFWNHLRIDPVRDEQGTTLRFVGVQDDVTQRRADLVAARTEAHVDDLTGLPNRRALLEEVRNAEARALRHHEPVTVLFLDLDGFKEVNDRHGHRAGDEVLRGIANRLQHVIRRDEFLARLGGDEFLILLERTDEEEAMAAARRILGALDADRGGDPPMPHASIGSASGTPPDVSVIDLVARADAALYAAKASGGARVATLTSEEALRRARRDFRR